MAMSGARAGSRENLLAAHQKFASMQSMQSMASIGYLPPGHGYIPRKYKPEKPYGPSYVSRMNRTWRGPGKKYMWYALGTFIMALLSFSGSALYFGHRNVSRMMVFRTEVFGAIMTISGILFTAFTFRLIYKARMASNHWRGGIRFMSEGLLQVVPFNDEYHPEDRSKNLRTGTYGPRALTQIPKPKARRKKKKAASQAATPAIPEEGPMQSQKPMIHDPYRRPGGQHGYRGPYSGGDEQLPSMPDPPPPPPHGHHGNYMEPLPEKPVYTHQPMEPAPRWHEQDVAYPQYPPRPAGGAQMDLPHRGPQTHPGGVVLHPRRQGTDESEL